MLAAGLDKARTDRRASSVPGRPRRHKAALCDAPSGAASRRQSDQIRFSKACRGMPEPGGRGCVSDLWSRIFRPIVFRILTADNFFESVLRDNGVDDDEHADHFESFDELVVEFVFDRRGTEITSKQNMRNNGYERNSRDETVGTVLQSC